MRVYQNYHRHSHYTNTRISDSVVSNKEYAVRAVELGQSILSTCEHGWQGNYAECYDIAKENGLKMLFASEAYWVKDRLEKDNTNCHIFLAAKNENGRQALNDALSEANISGFYGRPRLDLDLISSLPSNDIWCTSACVAGWLYEDADELWKKIAEHFGKNFFLEVQYHETDKQAELNNRILQLSKSWNVPIIMGCDSHYIKKDSGQNRTDFLVSKGITYPEEEGWYMDMPDGDTAYERFVKQGVLNGYQIEEAISNTNVFADVEEYCSPIFNEDIKMPSIYPEWSQEQKDEEYKRLVWSGWESYKRDVDESLHEKYEGEISKEIQTVIDTHMADYFIDNYHIIKRGKENGGWLTKTGRGCFTGDSMIHTTNGLKLLRDVAVGDYVFDQYGNPQRVLNKFEYNIDEELIELSHPFSFGKNFQLQCTLDHKILVFRDGHQQWVQAKDVTTNDYVVTPTIHLEDRSESVIDLNVYNKFGYEFDDDFIYEENSYRQNEYKFSPTDVAKHTGWGKSIIEKVANGVYKPGKKTGTLFEDILSYTEFKTIDDYAKYIKEKRTTKLKRFIPNDELTNTFIGMMYGDGCASEGKTRFSLYVRKSNHKNDINRRCFLDMMERLGLSVSEFEQKTDLVELVSSSNIVSNWIKTEMFVSKKMSKKTFNNKFLFQSYANRKAVANGLTLTDGSTADGRRDCFDNTSLSIINAYKLLQMSFGNLTSVTYRAPHRDPRRYLCSESYKVRSYDRDKTHTKADAEVIFDDNYAYVKVSSVTNIGKVKTKVYDIEVENTHSYVLGNIVVHNSAVSFITNKLLGFTEVDRVSASIKMFPERFMSTTRILESHSLPDVDYNVASAEPFAKAQQEVLGEDHAYPMIAYGTMLTSAALVSHLAFYLHQFLHQTYTDL